MIYQKLSRLSGRLPENRTGAGCPATDDTCYVDINERLKLGAAKVSWISAFWIFRAFIGVATGSSNAVTSTHRQYEAIAGR